jgi:hypothetical protein
LLFYAEDRDQYDWYFGNRKQFEKRHASILEVLERAIAKVTVTSTVGQP